MPGIIGRRKFERDIVFTTIVVAKVEVKDGSRTLVTLPNEVIIGTMNMEQAQRHVNTLYGEPVVVLEISKVTQRYELSVEDFVKYGRVKDK